MIASATLRFGMVGAGRIAQTYAQAFRDTNIADLVDVRSESAEAIAQSIGASSSGRRQNECVAISSGAA